ncbi:hypothetical protein ZWY2020_021860 [Hordeum vulgare]|nr:hypothetical protein ZWY2020_021860 [Hordeum vulgare]
MDASSTDGTQPPCSCPPSTVLLCLLLLVLPLPPAGRGAPLLGPNGATRTLLCLEEEEASCDRAGDGVDADEGAAATNVPLLLLGSFFAAPEENRNLEEKRSRETCRRSTVTAAGGGCGAGQREEQEGSEVLTGDSAQPRQVKSSLALGQEEETAGGEWMTGGAGRGCVSTAGK